MRKISTARSSRRAPPLKDTDYDHEIDLVDHVTEPKNRSPEPLLPQTPIQPQDDTLSPRQTTTTDHTALSVAGPSRTRSGSQSTVKTQRSSSHTSVSTSKSKQSKKSKSRAGSKNSLKQAVVPSVEVEREGCPKHIYRLYSNGQCQNRTYTTQ